VIVDGRRAGATRAGAGGAIVLAGERNAVALVGARLGGSRAGFGGGGHGERGGERAGERHCGACGLGVHDGCPWKRWKGKRANPSRARQSEVSAWQGAIRSGPRSITPRRVHENVSRVAASIRPRPRAAPTALVIW